MAMAWQGYSSSAIGLASVPAAIGQSIASQLAGRCSGQAQQRRAVLVGAVADVLMALDGWITWALMVFGEFLMVWNGF